MPARTPSSLTLTRGTGQVGKVLGERWKALSPTQREPYEAKAKADKERYDAEKATYAVRGNVPHTSLTLALLTDYNTRLLAMMTRTKSRRHSMLFLHSYFSTQYFSVC